MNLAINTRVVAFQIGGQQRVALEVAKRLDGATQIRPAEALGGVKGHLWEQFALPLKARGRLLWSPSATGPLACRNQVVTVHDVAFLDAPEYFSASFRLLYENLVPALMRRVAKVVTVSEFSRQRIVARTGRRRRQDRRHRQRRRRTIQAAQVPTTLRACGRRCNCRSAISSSRRPRIGARTSRARSAPGERALPSLPSDLWLVVSGSRERAHVFGEAGAPEASPRTLFVGYVAEENMAPLIGAAEAFLFPSLYEGFGIPILEAMACATPVLTSDATATREIAEDKALLVDPTDEASIAARHCRARERRGAEGETIGDRSGACRQVHLGRCRRPLPRAIREP